MIVESQTGKIRGAREGEVCVFRGIPFAEPPTGLRRFRAPAPVAPWAGVREALVCGPAAVQHAGPMSADITRRDEDCLYLNIWSPAADHARRPVMVWLHGGGFLTGSGGEAVCQGGLLAAREDVVVVTLNYRLGVLGFASFADVVEAPFEAESNLGLRDQILALQWVSENIEAFGGDPGNVTIFGESAGAMSVGTLMGTPAAAGLFHRAIAQSGAAHHTSTREDAARMAHTLLAALEISASRPDKLREVSTAQLLAAQTACMRVAVNPEGARQRPVVLAMPLLPTVDGELLPTDPADAIAQGAVADVPLLVGSTLDEWMLFVRLVETRKAKLDAAGLLKACERRLPGRAEALLARYREVWERPSPVDPMHQYVAFESDRMFRVPALRLAEAQQPHQANTYVYEWHKPAQALGGRLGACHAVEIPFVFGTAHTPFGKMFASDDEPGRSLSARVMSAWASFARTGQPVLPEAPAWPAYDVAQRATMAIDDVCDVVSAPRDAERALWDAHL